MNRLAAFVVNHARLAWLVALCLILAVAALSSGLVRMVLVHDRQEALETDVERLSVAVMSETMAGTVMGALDMMGAVEPALKYDAQGFMPPNGVQTLTLLQTLGQAYEVDGVFVVGTDGVITSSWNRAGPPSTGTKVGFRPYFKTAMAGQPNIYAAVSLATGERSLYFCTPVHEKVGRDSPPVGAVVARSVVDRLEAKLKTKGDVALLLSPQGVVFAGTNKDWIGRLAGKTTPERLEAIRQLKQFGAMFEKADPPPLPFLPKAGQVSINGSSHLMAMSPVSWNDPAGDWTLVLAEDLSRTAPAVIWLSAGGGVGAAAALVGFLLLSMLKAHHARMESARTIEAYAHAQEAASRRKSALAEASRRFQRAKSPEELCRVFLAEAHRLLGALHGLIYRSESDGGLRLIGAFADDGSAAPRLGSGEGLMGQAAIEHRPLTLSLAEVEGFRLISGLGDARPAAVLIAPLLLDEAVLGVVEVALITAPDPCDQDMFDEMAALLALNLEILCRPTTGGAVMTEARA